MYKVLGGAATLLLVSAIFSFYSVLSTPFTPRVVFLSVGQGDGALILPEYGYQILIDGGPGGSIHELLARYIPAWDRKIELLVLTHPHADHINGLLEVLDRYDVENVYYNPVCKGGVLYEEFLNRLAEENLIEVEKREVFSKEKGWVLNILYPYLGNMDDQYCDSSGNINNASVVLEFIYDQKKILFMGDAEKELEYKLIERKLLGDVDILKAGHHCSKTSSSEKFLDIVTAEIAICSVGESNMYGHPSPETIEKFESRGIDYYITWEVGDIVVNL